MIRDWWRDYVSPTVRDLETGEGFVRKKEGGGVPKSFNESSSVRFRGFIL